MDGESSAHGWVYSALAETCPGKRRTLWLVCPGQPRII